MLSAQPNRDTLMKSCHDFSVSSDHKFEAKCKIWRRLWELLIGDDVNLTINHQTALSKRELLFNKLDQVQAMLEPSHLDLSYEL